MLLANTAQVLPDQESKNPKDWVLPPPVTVYIRGPIKGYINHIRIIIQLLLRGGSTEPKDLLGLN